MYQHYLKQKMKHVEKVIKLLNTKEKENHVLAHQLITKDVKGKPERILGWLSILILTGRIDDPVSETLQVCTKEYAKVFDEPISWEPRDILNKAMNGNHPSTFSLKYAFEMYQEYMNDLYNSIYSLLEKKENAK
jgi:hypothetical protein